ncbi:hypothetical protein [Lacinutrix venerupis]|uniref:GLPGLI family protein n=1 Tax=Lacinutrix venerupis TaxID=1486034 RepID=A0AAC9LL45_9FLAO|nr:hypothetical protein [Lacinutrix venerupis]APY00454.1 hypothetical protein BWR22_09020 [Lacinutrix venerupis]
MKITYLTFVFCLFLSFSNSQNNNTKIVKDFIENFNKKDSIATLDALHKNFAEYWNTLQVYKNKKEYSNYYSWSSVMQDYEEIEIISDTKNKIVVNSTYYSDLDKLLGKLPYKSKKTFILSKGKILKIISERNKGYTAYQNKRKSAYIKFKNWLSRNHNLKRNDFKMNRNDALKMRKIVLEYISKDEIVDRD